MELPSPLKQAVEIVRVFAEYQDRILVQDLLDDFRAAGLPPKSTLQQLVDLGVFSMPYEYAYGWKWEVEHERLRELLATKKRVSKEAAMETLGKLGPKAKSLNIAGIRGETGCSQGTASNIYREIHGRVRAKPGTAPNVTASDSLEGLIAEQERDEKCGHLDPNKLIRRS